MVVLCYFISIIIGAIVGYMGYPWYFIFFGGLINTFVYVGIIFPDIPTKVRKKRGEFGYLIYFVWLIVPSSGLPAIAYLIFKLPTLL